MTVGLPLLKSELTPLSKSILLPLGLAATEASVTDAANQKNIFRSWTTLVFSNEEIDNIIK